MTESFRIVTSPAGDWQVLAFWLGRERPVHTGPLFSTETQLGCLDFVRPFGERLALDLPTRP